MRVAALEEDKTLRDQDAKEKKAFTDDEGRPFFDDISVSTWMEQEIMRSREED